MSFAALSIQSHDEPHKVTTGQDISTVHVSWGASWLHLHRPVTELRQFVTDLDAAVTELEERA